MTDKAMVGTVAGIHDPHYGIHPENQWCSKTPECVSTELLTPSELEVAMEQSREKAQFDAKSRGFVTKDSGQRQEYDSGMVRDVQDGKPRFGLIFPVGVPYKDQILTRFAELLARGAEKYGENNWQLANSYEELTRFRESALRHMVQWACGETDEDHAAAVIFNLMAYEATHRKKGAGG